VIERVENVTSVHSVHGVDESGLPVFLLRYLSVNINIECIIVFIRCDASHYSLLIPEKGIAYAAPRARMLQLCMIEPVVIRMDISSLQTSIVFLVFNVPMKGDCLFFALGYWLSAQKELPEGTLLKGKSSSLALSLSLSYSLSFSLCLSRSLSLSLSLSHTHTHTHH